MGCQLMLVQDPLTRDLDKRQLSRTQLRRSQDVLRHQMTAVEEERSRYTDPGDVEETWGWQLPPVVGVQVPAPWRELVASCSPWDLDHRI